ncbi:MAG: ribonuclease P protein component [Paracoccaceae bacterium]
MTPPEATVQGQDGRGTEAPPAVSVCLTLSKRADFLKAAQARRHGAAGFLLQARERRPDEAMPDAIRIGYTCSKKLGNAATRNRAKRRLREIARAVLPAHGRPGWDYVLVGRPEATVSRDFAEMKADLVRALGRIHASRP